MKYNRRIDSTDSVMRKYYQLILVVVCFVSVVLLLIYRHEYYRLRYVLEVLNIFGKPGLSQIEFCGPGFNATLLSEIVRNSSLDVRETPPLFQEIDDDFYSYSAFLRSYKKFESLTPVHAHNIDTIVIGKAHTRPNFRCNIWLENSNRPKAGRFSFKVMSEPIKDYRLYVFHCSLSKDIGKPTGISFYRNDYNVDPIHAPIIRVIEVNTRRKSRKLSNIQFVNKIELAACVIPNQVPLVSKDALMEFLVFHRMMGISQFTVYDSMITDAIVKRLNLIPSDITQWQIQFFPLNYPFVFAKSYEIIRNAVELDCLFRHFRFDKDETDRASHSVVLSWDEYLVPRVDSNIRPVLNEFDPTRKLRSYEVKPLLFCLNQNDDENSDIDHPDIIKKTHYYNIPVVDLRSVFIRNLDSMMTFEDIFNLNYTNTIPLEVLGLHKYTECRDPKIYNADGSGYNEAQMQVFQHKFEGAMLKFANSFMNNKVYNLYKHGQIWEKGSHEEVREAL